MSRTIALDQLLMSCMSAKCMHKYGINHHARGLQSGSAEQEAPWLLKKIGCTIKSPQITISTLSHANNRNIIFS